MKTFFGGAIAGIFAALGALYIALNYVPLNIIAPVSSVSSTFGGATSITTIQGTDTLSSSRTVINNNFSSLNTNKVEVTDLAATTSLKNLAQVGTINTGTWNASTIQPAYGGTGSTTLSANQILLGNGTTQVGVVNGLGASGQFLTSQGPGLPPIFTTAAIDLTASYIWKGAHLFGNSSAASSSQAFPDTVAGNFVVTATTTVSGLISTTSAQIWNGLHIELPALDGASGSPLSTNGSGKLSFQAPALQSFIPPIPYSATSSLEIQMNTNTTALFYNFDFEGMKVASSSFLVSAIGTAGTMKVGIYSGDGQTLYTQGTTQSLNQTGVNSVTFSPPVVLPAGNYYIAFMPVGTADITLRAYNLDGAVGGGEADEEQRLFGVTGEPHAALTKTGLSAGTLPSTFDPTTNLGTNYVLFRLDAN